MTLMMLQLEPDAPSGKDGSNVEPLALSFEQRKRSRFRMPLADGRELAWALTAGQVLRPGDFLSAACGAWFEVRASVEKLLRIGACSPQTLARAAYHLGNRHVTVEVGADYLAIEPDPVLRDMLIQLGVQVEEVDAVFLPETGAYGGGHKHGHDETFASDHALSQHLYVLRDPAGASASPVIEPDHSHDHPHAHAHDPAHGHSHPPRFPVAVGTHIDELHGQATRETGQRPVDDHLD
jgi:urease accessory protein